MSNTHSTYRRRLGRAPSPPTWLWYEQIPFADDTSDSDNSADYESCSEDDEDYSRRDRAADARDRDHDDHDHDSESGSDDSQHPLPQQRGDKPSDSAPAQAQNTASEPSEKMDVDERADGSEVRDAESESKKDIKGKQRAVEPELEEPKRRERRKKQRKPVYTLRPILTIQKSQGFVWNQDLFVPPYIKDRYVASTSPPNAAGIFSTSASSLTSINDYEVDVVEIRVKEGEYSDIIP